MQVSALAHSRDSHYFVDQITLLHIFSEAFAAESSFKVINTLKLYFLRMTYYIYSNMHVSQKIFLRNESELTYIIPFG